MRRGSGRRSGGELLLAKSSVVSTLSNEESLLTAVAAVTPTQLEPGREELNPAAGLSNGSRKLGVCVQQSWLLPWDECFGQDPDWQQAISDVWDLRSAQSEAYSGSVQISRRPDRSLTTFIAAKTLAPLAADFKCRTPRGKRLSGL
jgi:hypothetical protein